MNILYIGSKIPFPTLDGGSYASLQFVKHLTAQTTVDALFIETKKHPLTKEAKTKLAPFFNRLYFQKLDTSVSIWGLLKHLFSGKNYNLNRFRSATWETKLKEVIEKESYAYIIADSLYAAAQLLAIPNLPPLIIRAHNIENQIWEKQAAHARNPLKKWYLKQLYRTLKKEEIVLFHKAETIWTMSQNDTQWIYQHLPQKDVVLLPVAMDLREELIDPIAPAAFHLGSMDWGPNQEAVEFLVNELFADERLAKFTLHLAGKGMQNHAFHYKNIVNHGFVSDLPAFYKEAGILVTPIFSGSGIRVKILEAMSYGIPVITTTLGASGIRIEESGIVIANDKEAFIESLVHLINNPAERQALGKKGFDYIQKEHSFKLVNDRLKYAIKE